MYGIGLLKGLGVTGKHWFKREITEQYDGQIIAGDSLLGGARMEVIFGRQQPGQKDE